ncbi:hypothetical protein Emag_006516 [Eimeria magna]
MPRPGASIAAAAAAAAASAAADKTPSASVFKPRTRKQQQQVLPLSPQHRRQQQDNEPQPEVMQQQLQICTPRLTPIERRLTRLSIRGSGSTKQGPPLSEGPPPSQGPLSKQRPPLSASQSSVSSTRQSTPVKRGSSSCSSSCCSSSASNHSVRAGIAAGQGGTAAHRASRGGKETAEALSAVSLLSPLARGRSVAPASPQARRAPCRDRFGGPLQGPQRGPCKEALSSPCRGPSRSPSSAGVSTAPSFINLSDLAGRPLGLSSSPLACRSSRSSSPCGAPCGTGAPRGPLVAGEGESSVGREAAAEDAAADWEQRDTEELYRLALQALRPSASGYCGGREDCEREVHSFIKKHVEAQRGGLLYFCGASGVGKTCVARHALNEALGDPQVAEACRPQVVSLSCAHREKDIQLLGELLCRLLNKPTEDKTIRRQARESRMKLVVVKLDLRDRLQSHGIVGAANSLCLVDEVDFLVTRGQIRVDMGCPSGSNSRSSTQQQQQQHDALLALALAATHPQSRILVVAISNSTELANHLSGLHIRTVIVAPYTEKEILQIINSRLAAAKQQLLESRRVARGRAETGAPQEVWAAPPLSADSLPPLFAPAALLLFARKAANANGDIRMALSGLCRAVEEKLTELQEARDAVQALEEAQNVASLPVSPLPNSASFEPSRPREKRRQAGLEAQSGGVVASAGRGPSEGPPPQQAADSGTSASAPAVQAAEAAGQFLYSSPPPPSTKAPRYDEQSRCVSSALRKKPPLLSALESELACTEGSPPVLSLSHSLEGSSGRTSPDGSGFPPEKPEASAQTPQSLCSTAPSPAAASAAAAAAVAAAAVSPPTPAALAKQELCLSQHTVDEESPLCSSAPLSCSKEEAPAEALVSRQGPLAGEPFSEAPLNTGVRAPNASPASAPLGEEQQLLPCCSLESLPAELLLQHWPHTEAASRSRRDSKCSSSGVSSSQSLRRGLVGLRGARSLSGGASRRGGLESGSGGPSTTSAALGGAAGGGPSTGSRRSVCSVGEETACATSAGAGLAVNRLSRRASESIGVGAMSTKASAVYGHDQQQIVSRIQGLPLMQRVYLLAACRSAQKKLLNRAAAATAATAATTVARPGERRRASAATLSQGSRSSQTENDNPASGPLDAGGVHISLEEVELQYKLLAEELPHGYLLNGKMGSSCWRHAVESFEQMGLMVAAAAGSGGAPGLGAPNSSGLLLQGSAGSRLPRRGRPSLGALGLGGRRSAGGNLGASSFCSASHAKSQAWQLQLSPALVEAAIKRLQPQLMGSDIEGHFSRGLEA